MIITFLVGLFALLCLEPVKGFNVFKSSKSAAVTEENNQTEDEIAQGKKELYRKMEVFPLRCLFGFMYSVYNKFCCENRWLMKLYIVNFQYQYQYQY